MGVCKAKIKSSLEGRCICERPDSAIHLKLLLPLQRLGCRFSQWAENAIHSTFEESLTKQKMLPSADVFSLTTTSENLHTHDLQSRESLSQLQTAQLRSTLTSIYKFDNLALVSRPVQSCQSHHSQPSQITLTL